MKKQKIKVFVVEDEILLLNNICKKICSVSSDFSIIGKAYNGKEALEIIKNCRPDIVFTDIRMPIMDGLELSRILHEEYPDILLVIVSGYDDFQYAHSAMHIGVSDYLLKPLLIEPLRKLLFTLQHKLESRRRQLCQTFLNEQLHGIIPLIPSDFTDELEQIPFSMFLISFGNLNFRCKPNDFSKYIQATLDAVTWDSLFEHAPFSFTDYYIIPQDASNMQTLLIEDASVSTKEMALYLHTSLCQSLPQGTICLAHTKAPVPYSQLFTTLNDLNHLMSYSYVINVSSVFSNPRNLDNIPPAVLSLKEARHLQTIINTNNIKQFQTVMQEYFNYWEENQNTQQWIEKILLQILSLLQQNLSISDEAYEQMYQNIFYALETKPTLASASREIVLELTYWLNANSTISTEIEHTIEELYGFICSHYTEAINLADLAEKYHFNHSYLTRIFKKQKGISPIKLINTLRINDAKKLLENSDLSIREISEMLGFSNQHYFSHIFKDFTGKNPKEHRLS